MRHEAPPAFHRSGFFLHFLDCASGFWRGPTAWTSRALAAFLFVGVLLALLTQYWLNIWNRDFFNALERKDGAAIGEQVLLFLPLAFCSVTLAIAAVWGRMTLQRTWRYWLSRRLIDQWLAEDRYRRLALVGDHQNPEYRIAEDARVATDAPVDFAVGLLTSLLTACVFIGVLWNVGGDLSVEAFGGLALPGYLVIAAVAYAAIATGGMLVIGRSLVRVFEDKNQAEAELRQSATRLRENAAQDDNHEDRHALQASLEQLMGKWRSLCRQLLQTTLISHGNLLLAPIVALALCAPKYLAGSMSLGEVTQAAAAFVTVQGAFNWLVDNYPRLADWASSANRVGSLLVSFEDFDDRARGSEDEADAERQSRG